MFPVRDHNPSTRTPYVTYAIIFLSLAMFMLTQGWSNQFNEAWVQLALYPEEVTHGEMLWGLAVSYTHLTLPTNREV